ncbi:hypothetical protein [Maricaulis sp.]|uniref:tetratricopeptide repeat protein n=1 Tax=Maricaulis sp. TaxID=1486257 RepID=UPI00262A5FA1|nr:hypothetical protein [Maricaulis sp.]
MLRTFLVATVLATSAAGLASATMQTDIDAARLQAEAGDFNAAFDYGYALTFPESGDADYEIGRYWLVQAADNGIAEADHVLGLVYRDGIGVDADLDRARAFFETSWSRNYAPAGFNLAELLIFDYESDAASGVAILRRLAEGDNGVDAQLMLADALFFGPDTIRDDSAAIAAAEAAIARDPAALQANYILGIAAMEGLGRTADPAAAIALWRAAADTGDTLSLGALAQAYTDGDGVTADPVEALALWQTAAALGDFTAAEAAAELEDQLNAGQQQQAETRAQARLAQLP